MAAFHEHHQLEEHVLFEHADSELNAVYQPNSRISAEAHISSMQQYEQMYKQSVDDPVEFWREISKQFYWECSSENFLSYNFDVNKGPIFIKWMEGAKTNICFNVLDRIVKENGQNTIAFYWLVSILLAFRHASGAPRYNYWLF